MAGSTVGGGEGGAQTSPPTQQPIQFGRAGPVPAAARPGGSWPRSPCWRGRLGQMAGHGLSGHGSSSPPHGQAREMAGVARPAYCWCTIGSRAVLGSRGGRSRGGCWAVAEPELSFAGLLRQLRAQARLTQEELAEAASLSPQTVAALERGVHRTARKDTAVLLADALGLAEQVRAVFVAAARGKAPAAGVLAARQGVTPGGFAAARSEEH